MATDRAKASRRLIEEVADLTQRLKRRTKITMVDEDLGRVEPWVRAQDDGARLRRVLFIEG